MCYNQAMADQQLIKTDPEQHRPWKRIAGQEVKKLEAKAQTSSHINLKDGRILNRFLVSLAKVISRLYLRTVHHAARVANKPVVDIGREYSVSALNDRINTLEEILVRQWSQLKDDDFLSPNEEVKQYIAACHVARQYDRITAQLLSSRLGISQNKAEQLLDQLMEDEVITESYTVSYHDVRRTMIDPTIERKLSTLPQITPTDTVESQTKKH